MLGNRKIRTFILITIIVAYIIAICYTAYHQGGWYCKYCYKGYATDNKDLVIKLYEHDYCKYSADSIHHFTYYFKRPKIK